MAHFTAALYIRRMHDKTAVAAGDAQVLADSLHRKATVAAAFQADGKRVSVVPATRALIQVPAQRSQVADLRCGQACRGLRQRGVAVPDSVVAGDVGNRGQRPNAYTAAVGDGDAVWFRFGDGVKRNQGPVTAGAVPDLDSRSVPSAAGTASPDASASKAHASANESVEQVGKAASMGSRKRGSTLIA